MSDSVVLVTVDDVARAYDFGSSHPLRPERVLLTYEHIRSLDMLYRENVRQEKARSATDDEIAAAHDREFIETVKKIDSGELDERAGLEFGLGTPDDPIFKNMHAASAAVAGASIVAAEAVASGRAQHSFNPAGGLHHARRREASGFCIYNDPAIAIAKVHALQPDWRVVYIDVDVHHGDGVQWIFYDDPRVLTISFHQSGRYLYPGTGFEDEIGNGDAAGTAANIPLLPYSGEGDYLWAMERVLPALMTAFMPQIVVTQLGADTHHGDPLANLALTMPAYPRMARLLHELIHEHGAGRWVATGGGGYQYDTFVPKIWAIHWAEMIGAPELIPSNWLHDVAPETAARSYMAELERSVERVLEACVPRLEALAAR